MNDAIKDVAVRLGDIVGDHDWEDANEAAAEIEVMVRRAIGDLPNWRQMPTRAGLWMVSEERFGTQRLMKVERIGEHSPHPQIHWYGPLPKFPKEPA